MDLCLKEFEGSGWDRFIESSPHGSVFLKKSFLDSLGTPYKLLCVSQGDHPLLALPILFEKEGMPLVAPHHFTLYQGPVLAGELFDKEAHAFYPRQHELMAFALEELGKLYPKISFCTHPQQDDLRAFSWFHYHEPELGQFQIDLRYTGRLSLGSYSSFDDYFPSIRSVRRYEYRHATRIPLQLVMGGMEQLGIFRELYLDTFARQGITVSEQELTWVTSITRSALEGGYGELAFAVDPEGHHLAGILFLYDPNCSYYLFSTSDTRFRKSGGNTFLLLEFIRRSFERGMKEVDFIGLNSPGRGDYKTSFNARPVPYYVVKWEKR